MQFQSSQEVRRIRIIALVFLFAFAFTSAQTAFAQTETILYSFCALPHCNDGNVPAAELLLDAGGNLYGTTIDGGAHNFGVVFKIAPNGTETVLHSFNDDGIDGANPEAFLMMDKNGSLYGTTVNGGTTGMGGATGFGTVFRLGADGTETILHSFGTGTDGQNPYSGLTADSEGNLFGTTAGGGASGSGTVFRLRPDGTETVLHSFGPPKNGLFPETSLLIDTEGNLYSTDILGGAGNEGCVFELNTTGQETLLHSFIDDGVDGLQPRGLLFRDAEGNLYGTTGGGGTHNAGAVYRMTPGGAESVIHSFASDPDGSFPDRAGIIMDGQGSIYGTTFGGGFAGGGTLYKISNEGVESILHSFASKQGDGFEPLSGLIMDSEGNLYGTTSAGGAYGGGTIFKITP